MHQEDHISAALGAYAPLELVTKAAGFQEAALAGGVVAVGPKVGTTDGDIPEDARVEVKYSDQSDDPFEYDIHVVDRELPSDWVLEDLVIWAEGLVWGRTNRAHDRHDRPGAIDVLYRNA